MTRNEIVTKPEPWPCSMPVGAVNGTEWEPCVAAVIAVERSVLLSNPPPGCGSVHTKAHSISPIGPSLPGTPPKPFANTGESKTPALHARRHAARRRLPHPKQPGHLRQFRSFAYNILRSNQSDTIAQDRYAAALGGLKSLSALHLYKER